MPPLLTTPFIFKNLFCVCTRVSTSYMYMDNVSACCHQKPEELVVSPGTGVTEGCEPLWRCWEPNLGPLLNQKVCLTAESSSSTKSQVLNVHVWFLRKTRGLRKTFITGYHLDVNFKQKVCNLPSQCTPFLQSWGHGSMLDSIPIQWKVRNVNRPQYRKFVYECMR